jgi:uncharacterized membrane protein YbhN (UPF0104 family)
MKYKSLLKIALSALMLVLVLRVVNFDKLSAVMTSLSLEAVILIVSLYALGQVLSACKWWILLSNAGLHVSLSKTLKSYFIGMFVNCFGLGTVGGDLTRALLVSTGDESKISAISSVVADRAHGLAVLATIGSSAALIFGSSILAPQYMLTMIIVGLCTITGWFLGPVLVRTLLPVDHRLRHKMEEVLRVFPNQKRVLLFMTFISFCFHVLQISLHYVMGYFLFLDLPLKELFVIIPLINILSTLPISWNGLGVREKAYQTFLAPTLISNEQALAFGALWLLSVTICSAIGGLFAVLSEDFRDIWRYSRSAKPAKNPQDSVSSRSSLNA